MKKVFLALAVLCTVAMMAGCKGDNSPNKGGWSFHWPGSTTNTTNASAKSNSILDTKWIIGERSKDDAVYIFINQDSSVVVAYDGADKEYGYVYGMDEDCIKIKINAYNSIATRWEGSRLFIDRKNNHLYAGLDAYKSRDPRKRQCIAQIPMSDYKGEKVEVQPYQTMTPRRED